MGPKEEDIPEGVPFEVIGYAIEPFGHVVVFYPKGTERYCRIIDFGMEAPKITIGLFYQRKDDQIYNAIGWQIAELRQKLKKKLRSFQAGPYGGGG